MIRESWANDCISKGLLYRLENEGATALFLCRGAFWGARECYYTGNMFHVWRGEKWLYCGPDYQTAYRVYEEAINGLDKR